MAAPSSPQNFIATARPNGVDIQLQWLSIESYDVVQIQRDVGSGWVAIYDGVDGEGYTDESVTQNVNINYRIRGKDLFSGLWSAWIAESAGCYADTLTDAFSLADSLDDVGQTGDIFLDIFSMAVVLDEVGVYDETFTETFSLGDYLLDSESIRTNYAYYLGASTGDVYEYSEDSKSYAGDVIESRWESKEIDFSDQLPHLRGFFKTVYGARLYYVDLDADTQVGIGFSTDGGATWSMGTKTIGSGTGAFSTKDFHFITTTYSLRIAIVHSSADKRFQWTGIKLLVDSAGEFFEI